MDVQNANTDAISRLPIRFTILVIFASIVLIAALYAIFFVAPVESRMGIVQKIFYFHVPSAYAMYVSFITCAVASAIYLAKSDERWDGLALAAAEVGALFCIVVLTTGPLWAKKAWGVYWLWEPRLTSTLLTGLIYFGYLTLHSLGTAGGSERRFAAALGVVGALNIPTVHFAVYRWKGIHPTVVRGGGLEPQMWLALILGLVLFTIVAVVLIWLRTRTEALRRQIEAFEAETSAHPT